MHRAILDLLKYSVVHMNSLAHGVLKAEFALPLKRIFIALLWYVGDIGSIVLIFLPIDKKLLNARLLLTQIDKRWRLIACV